MGVSGGKGAVQNAGRDVGAKRGKWMESWENPALPV